MKYAEMLAVAFAVIFGVAAAAFTLYLMFGEGGGLGLPKGRYPIILLIVIVVGPPLIAGAVGAAIGGIAIGGPLMMLAHRRQKRADTREKEERERKQAVAREKNAREEADDLIKVRRAIADGDVATIQKASARDGSFFWKVLEPDPATGTTVGHMAALRGHAGVFEALTSDGVFRLYRDGDGKTMLDVGTPEQMAANRKAYARGFGQRIAKVWKLKSFDEQAGEAFTAFLESRAAQIPRGSEPHTTLSATRGDIEQYLSDTAMEAANKREYPRAIALANAAVEVLPDVRARPYLARAHARLYSDRFEEALADAEKALELDAGNFWAYELRGGAYAMLGRHAEAIADFMKSLEFNRNQPRVVEQLAAARRDLDRQNEIDAAKVREAIASGDTATFQQAMSRDTGFLWHVLAPNPETGTTAAHLAALKGYADIIEMIPANGLFRLHRDRNGKTMLDVGTPEQMAANEAAYCRGYARRLCGVWKLGSDPQVIDVFAQWVATRAALRQSSSAQIFLVDGTSGQAATFFCNASAAATTDRNYPRSLLLANAAVTLVPDAALPYRDRCVAYLNLGQTDAALADAKRAIKIDPKHYDGYRLRGIAYGMANRTKDAIADLSKSLELNPDQPNVQERLNTLVMS